MKPTPTGPVETPWGAYLVLEDSVRHKVKRISVKPGHRLSYQRHTRRSEHWYVISGVATVVLEGVEHLVPTGQAIDIPLHAAHRVANQADDLLEFIEVQTGDYFGEDDIERLDDDYGRAGA